MSPLRRTCILTLILGLFRLTGTAQVTAHYINVGQAASALIEFKSGAILIDAGGEDTGDDVYRKHLVAYLNDFFTKRPDLDRTLEGIILSHPHIDHTMYLMDVMQNFTVHALIDNGATAGSGIAPMKAGRTFATMKHIHYMAVGDTSIHKTGNALALVEGAGAPKILLLSGARGCKDANNDSITVRIETPETAILFAGDAENVDPTCTPELTALATKFAGTPLLQAQIYHVAHHGSGNGTTADFLKAVSPSIAVISAGDPTRQGPGVFHAYEYGHPREMAMDILVSAVTGARADFGGSSESVTIFPAVKQTKTITMTKAIYCTCWDGDITVAYAAGNKKPQISADGFHPVVPAKNKVK
jgi:competence protein ComEC